MAAQKGEKVLYRTKNLKGKSKKTVYVVARGRKRGVSESWNACQKQVSGYKGFRYKSFTKPEEAMNYILDDIDSAPPYIFSTEKKEYGYYNFEKYIGDIQSFLNEKLSRQRMLDYVQEAFAMEKEYQKAFGQKCKVTIDGYTDFIFINRFGATQHQGTLNKALHRIMRDCNDEQLSGSEKNPVLLPRFSCHSLRHTFTTRMVEAGVNIKVVQDVLGHKDVETTLNIYTDMTKELKQQEFDSLQKTLDKQKNKNSGE